ncbi:MAG TPA: ADP-ribosylglycohydrolase family protein [Acidimicrobiia bacterium]|nr:ADP-ribosylglycohydrolase family protein [Acidimicrobiia bacterium]
MDDSRTDRALGCLLGLAVGDALGAAVEFLPPGSFRPVTGMRGGGAHGLAPGQWTDDTSMALALADSILEVGWDLGDQARRYVQWWRTGRYSVTGECFDIGNTTAAALARFETDGDARVSGLEASTAAGNGSIMRLAPVAIATMSRYPDDVETVIDRCVESSLPTHRSPQATSACAVLGVMLSALLGGEDEELVLDPSWSVWEAVRARMALHPEVDEVISGSHSRRAPPDIVGSGYVVRSLEAALWALGAHSDFEGAVLAAVNLGDDADTTGAVCGQLAGARQGASAIPDEWLAGLAAGDSIAATARSLAETRL